MIASLIVLNLPQLYNRPSYAVLLDTLNLLVSAPPNLYLSNLQSNEPRERDPPPKVHPEGVTTYLTSIVSSPLSWLVSDGDREEIWELASKRLSERAGRAAAGDLIRKFRVPLRAPTPDGATEIELSLHEPSLTEDNLGLKTWGSSLVLASKLSSLTERLSVLEKPVHTTDNYVHQPVRVLELGSGTGLLGLAAACVWPQTLVKLTDLGAIVSNLRRNVEINREVLEQTRAKPAQEHIFDVKQGLGVETDVLDWSLSPPFGEAFVSTKEHDDATGRFDILLSSDPLYSPLHPIWLVNTIAANISLSREIARAIVAYPLRKGYEHERAEFERLMDKLGMECLESEVVGGVKEDWRSHDTNDIDEYDGENSAEEKVKWGIWAWK